MPFTCPKSMSPMSPLSRTKRLPGCGSAWKYLVMITRRRKSTRIAKGGKIYITDEPTKYDDEWIQEHSERNQRRFLSGRD
jgi:hypothetical protein